MNEFFDLHLEDTAEQLSVLLLEHRERLSFSIDGRRVRHQLVERYRDLRHQFKVLQGPIGSHDIDRAKASLAKAEAALDGLQRFLDRQPLSERFNAAAIEPPEI